MAMEIFPGDMMFRETERQRKRRQLLTEFPNEEISFGAGEIELDNRLARLREEKQRTINNVFRDPLKPRVK